MVAIVQGDLRNWDHSANAGELRARLANAQTPLLDLFTLFPIGAYGLRVTAPSHAGHAKVRIALLGDAAHPMRSYLAQRAGTAIEDAAKLARVLALPGVASAQALRQYPATLWERNARVQARTIRNGDIFHLQGSLRVGRDWSLMLFGRRLLDVP